MAPESDDSKREDKAREPERKLFSFDELPERIRKNVASIGWTAPLTVQEVVAPFLFEGRDVVVQSRTGSGKTGAFLLPICKLVDTRRDSVQALVLVPTRELAEQVHGVLRDLAEGTGIRSVAVYGGVGYGPQLDAFQKKVHVIVATPGRMIDHLMSGRVSLAHLRMLVLDEADEMLSMGFYQSMTKILSYVSDKHQTTLFSATISPAVARMAKRFTHNPEPITLSSDVMHVEEVDHVYYVVDSMYKDRAVLKIIEMENHEAALIFCNTKREVEYLGTFLRSFGYDGDYISGDLSQTERERVMTRIRDGKLRFLVATDVAARGIDISELGCVFLYNLPQAHENYIHRAGRTGRAGSGGLAISLVSIMEEIELKKRADRYGISLEKKELPTDEELEQKVAKRLTVMLEERYRGLSNLERERLQRFLPLARKQTEGERKEDKDDVTSDRDRVVAMLFDQFYQETLHKPLYPREEGFVKEKVNTDGPSRSREPRRDSPDGPRGRSGGGRGRSGGGRGRSGGGRGGPGGSRGRSGGGGGGGRGRSGGSGRPR
jgi:ATP-dependent RNA helicase DeaD